MKICIKVQENLSFFWLKFRSVKRSGSSGVEHYVDIVVVGGSNPLPNTI